MRNPVHRLRAALLAFLCGIAPACFGDEAAEREALAAASEAWIAALNAGDVDAMAVLVTADVVLLDPVAPPISGIEKAKAAWRVPARANRTRLASVDKETAIAGDFAWRIAAIYVETQAGIRAHRGYVLEIWKYDGGRWKLHRRMPANSSGLPAQLPRPLPSEPVLDEPRG